MRCGGNYLGWASTGCDVVETGFHGVQTVLLEWPEQRSKVVFAQGRVSEEMQAFAQSSMRLQCFELCSAGTA